MTFTPSHACVHLQAILNFDLSHYQAILDDPDSYDPGACESQPTPMAYSFLLACL